MQKAMSIHIKENKVPQLKKPSFLVDGQLHEKLDQYEITKLMNKSNFTLFCSKPGGGKSSTIISFLNTKNLFYQVFDHIYLFMGKNSRDSIKGSFFDKKLAPENIFDILDIENLSTVYEQIQDHSDAKETSLVIFDDVQKEFRDKFVEKQFLRMVNNRRHLRSSFWVANQTYFGLPRQIRMGITDIFLFHVSKTELACVNEEQLELPKDVFNLVIKNCFKEPHDFMYLNGNSQRVFSNWDEIIIDD
jgi:hypothetical protein